MHTRSLVHRDLKPSNLMLVGSRPDSTRQATLKILDIGLGRTLIEQGAGETVEGGLTGQGVLLGTPDYMAPEQARDARGIDIRADIYSLGCVLYHLLAGQPPFPDTNILTQMIRHASETPRPVKEFNPAVPDGLQQILDWMLAKDAAQALSHAGARRAGAASVSRRRRRSSGRHGSGYAHALVFDLAGGRERQKAGRRPTARTGAKIGSAGARAFEQALPEIQSRTAAGARCRTVFQAE